ncbi:MAG: hypothetical protein FDZ70_00105 [Actinobacteria bacterium]|nr:MAG: hypothetical protein FDZ70_00105 [Actinomycetota bacterium]
MTHPGNGLPTSAYRALGLVCNPFTPWAPDKGDTIGLALSTRAASSRLISALLAASAEERSRPVWVDKTAEASTFLSVLALAEVLEVLTEDTSYGVMPTYVQLQSMKGGRVRGALGAVAEKVAGSRVDLTLAAWTREALAEPDTALAEWAPLASADLGALLDLLRDDPAKASEEIYGVLKPEREGVRQDLEMLMRVSAARQERQEQEPEAADEDDGEEDLTDPAGEIFATPLAIPDAEDEPEGPHRVGGPHGPEAVDVAAYVVAYTKEHLSPVVARGIRVYVAQGTSAMSQDLKVTKAPRKTLGALARFACARYDKVALIWDRFDIWPMMEPDMRVKITTSLAETRWALADHGVMAILSRPGEAPELEEQFAAAGRVDWDMPHLSDVEPRGSAYHDAVVRHWLASAALDGARVWTTDDEPFATLAKERAGSIEEFCAAAAAAVDSAAARGDGAFADEDLAAGLAAAAAAEG